MGRVECVCGAGQTCEAGQGDSLQQAVGMGSDHVCGVLHFLTALWVSLEKAVEHFKIAKGEVSWLHVG